MWISVNTEERPRKLPPPPPRVKGAGLRSLVRALIASKHVTSLEMNIGPECVLCWPSLSGSAE